MAIAWDVTDFENGDALLSIREKINGFNNSVVVDVNLNTTTTVANTSSIVGLRTDTDTNTASITTNAGNITTNTTDIVALEALVNNYQVSQVSGISTTSSAYSSANSLTVSNAVPGTYEITLSMLFSYSSITRSAFFRFSSDGGVSWREVRQESKDLTDNIASTYVTTAVHTTGDLGIQVEYRAEADADILNVAAMDIIIDRKL